MSIGGERDQGHRGMHVHSKSITDNEKVQECISTCVQLLQVESKQAKHATVPLRYDKKGG